MQIAAYSITLVLTAFYAAAEIGFSRHARRYHLAMGWFSVLILLQALLFTWFFEGGLTILDFLHRNIFLASTLILLVISGISALLYLEHYFLKAKKLGSWISSWPAFVALDRILARMLKAAFYLVSVGLMISIVLAHQRWSMDETVSLWLQPKVFWVMMGWAWLAMLLWARRSNRLNISAVAILSFFSVLFFIAALVGIHR